MVRQSWSEIVESSDLLQRRFAIHEQRRYWTDEAILQVHMNTAKLGLLLGMKFGIENMPGWDLDVWMIKGERETGPGEQKQVGCRPCHNLNLPS